MQMIQVKPVFFFVVFLFFFWFTGRLLEREAMIFDPQRPHVRAYTEENPLVFLSINVLVGAEIPGLDAHNRR